MRSMFMLAALAAVISFSGCCGAGGQAGGCKGVGLFGGAKAKATELKNRRASADSVGDCGCGASGACGADSVVTVSTPYACDDRCGASGSMEMPMSAPSSCGCSSCDGGGAVEYAPAIESGSSGCSDCDSASAREPRGILARSKKKRALGGKNGLGLSLKGKGKACAEPRSLGPANDSMIISDYGVSTCDSCDSCSEGVEQTVAQMPNGFLFGGSCKGRRISSGIGSGARGAIGGERLHGCGKRGCGAGGKVCSSCAKLANATGAIHPYGGAIPHTNPAAGQQPQSGIAPQYAYPYYTTRGPRDFLQDNPPSIGY